MKSEHDEMLERRLAEDALPEESILDGYERPAGLDEASARLKTGILAAAVDAVPTRGARMIGRVLAIAACLAIVGSVWMWQPGDVAVPVVADRETGIDEPSAFAEWDKLEQSASRIEYKLARMRGCDIWGRQLNGSKESESEAF